MPTPAILGAIAFFASAALNPASADQPDVFECQQDGFSAGVFREPAVMDRQPTFLVVFRMAGKNSFEIAGITSEDIAVQRAKNFCKTFEYFRVNPANKENKLDGNSPIQAPATGGQ